VGFRQSVGLLLRSDKRRFLTLLLKQADVGVEALDMMARQECGCELSEAVLSEMDKLEARADELRLELIDELQSRFGTPFDREDIFALSKAVDDIVDAAQETAVEVHMYGIPVPPSVDVMAGCLRDGASEIRCAIGELLDRPHLSAEHALKAKKSENRMDGHYHSAISALLEGGRPTADVLKAREIYRHLKNSADLIDRAADHVCMIVIKRL
jgi:uncharacterized protein Yka (UPF0111/DUF47 family)